MPIKLSKTLQKRILFTLCLVMGAFSSCTTKDKYKVYGSMNPDRQDHMVIKDIAFGPTQANAKGVFTDRTEDYGLKDVEATHLYAVDFDTDNYTDLVLLSNFYSIPEFYEFDPLEKKFKKLSYSPLNNTTKYSFLIFADLNKDKIPDLIAGNIKRKTEMLTSPLDIYQGKLEKGKISYVKIEHPFDKEPYGPSAVGLFDYDLDGELDLYLGNWFSEDNYNSKNIVPDEFYKGKGFQFFNANSLLEGEYLSRDNNYSFYNAAPTYSVATCDINQDGWPDVLTASSAGYKNKLWINQILQNNERGFQDLGVQTLYAADDDGLLLPTGGGNTFFSACFDYNNDQIMDVFMGELTHPYDYKSRDRSSILTGSKLKFPFKFIRSELYHVHAKQDKSRCDRRAVFLDYNADGRMDMLVDNSGYPPFSRLILFKQQEDKSFEDVADYEGIDILNPSGTVSLDVNQDGLPDFITGQTSVRHAGIKKRVYLFVNQSMRTNSRSIKFHLVGKQSNSDALGAMVILRTRDEFMRQWISYSYGTTPSQNEKGVVFSMEGEDYPLLVEVRWPYKKNLSNGKFELMSKVYTFNQLEKKIYNEITLCEDGAWHLGKVNCE